MGKNLEESNYSAYQFFLDVNERFNAICSPLYAFGIPRFTYSKTFKDGSYLTLDSANDYLKQYLSQITTPGNLFINELKFLTKFQKRIFLPDNNINKFDKKTDPTIHLLYANNIWNNFYILNYDNDDYIELFGFSKTREDGEAANFYLNNIKLLERFVEYFKEKASDLIDTNDKKKLAYFDRAFTFGDKLADIPCEEKVKEFLKNTESKCIIGKNSIVKLAAREVECLQYLARGHNIKQIAHSLGLSERTIEFYISKAKQKTGYNVRRELINEFISQKLLYSKLH